MKAKYLFRKLKESARDSAYWHGHTLGIFKTEQATFNGKPIERYSATAHCLTEGCTAQVTIETHPMPNGIDIFGDAVAVGCPSNW